MHLLGLRSCGDDEGSFVVSTSDFSIRPSMSVMVKVLEGSVDVGSNLDYSFITAVVPRAITVAGHGEDDIGAATPLFPIGFIRTELKKRGTDESEEDYLNQKFLGMPMRFSWD
ncbi:unnamed protein product [Camellia sinensis]